MSRDLVESGNRLVETLKTYFRPMGAPGQMPSFLYEVDMGAWAIRTKTFKYEMTLFSGLLKGHEYIDEAIEKISEIKRISESLKLVNSLIDPESAPKFSFMFDRLLEKRWTSGTNWSFSFPKPPHEGPEILSFGFQLFEIDEEFLWDMKTSLDDIGPSKYSEPRRPSDWAKIFKNPWRTIKVGIDSGSIRAIEIHSKSWRIHIDDIPS